MPQESKDRANLWSKTDTWAGRFSSYWAALVILVVILAFLAKYLQTVALVILVPGSIAGILVGIFGPPRWRARLPFRVLCTAAALFCLAMWVHSLDTYTARRVSRDIVRYDLQVLSDEDSKQPQEIDTEKLRQEERDRVRAEYTKQAADIFELVIVWSWFASFVFWTLTVVYAISETHALLMLLLYHTSQTYRSKVDVDNTDTFTDYAIWHLGGPPAERDTG